LACLPLAAAVARAQGADTLATALDGRFVRSVELLTRNIFEPLPEHGGGFYAFADRLHVRTRAVTVRAALAFHAGERWSDAKRAESERHLRSLSFLVPDSVVALPVGRDSVDVLVVTRDNWTTSPEFSLESGGGQRFGSFSFTERNLMGFGSSLSLAYRSDVVGISRQLRLDDGELFGSHWRGRASIGNGSAGRLSNAVLELPFWRDDAPVSMGASWQRERFDGQLFRDGDIAATFPGRRESARWFWGTGRRAGDGTIQRFTAAFEAIDHSLGPSTLLAGAPAAFSGPEQSERIRRLSGEVRLWRPHYIVRQGVEQMDRGEDFDLGPSLQITTGFSPQALGGAADEGYWRVRLDAGHDAGPLGFGLLRTSVHSRVHSGLEETLAEGSVRWVQQPLPRTSLVAGVVAVAGRRMPRDFQLTLGGINGLRAFPVHELSGTQVWRANAELRWTGVRDWLRLVSLGGAAFWDSGRAWGAGAEGEPWHHDAGFGLRLSLPHSALNVVARFDVAWPISPAVDGRRGAAYSFGSGQAF
jgi:hypothetical protein